MILRATCLTGSTRSSRCPSCTSWSTITAVPLAFLGLLAVADAPGAGTLPSAPEARELIAEVLEETQALIDGTSPVIRGRVERLESIQGVLSL